MNRQLITNSALWIVIGLTLIVVCVSGCGKPSPVEVLETEENCVHQWVEAESGEIRCDECGLYYQEERPTDDNDKGN